MNDPLKLAALIPARGGSQRLPRKNLALVAGKPLLVRSIEVARGAGVSDIFVSTDDSEIARVAEDNGALVHWRTPFEANGKQPPDYVTRLWYRDLAKQDRPDAFVFLHTTYPFTTSNDVSKCIELLEANPALDVVYTAVVSHKHHFAGTLRKHPNLSFMLVPNRQPGYRPPTNTLTNQAHEGGGCWVVRSTHFESEHSRDARYDRCSQILIPEWRDIDIDREDELKLVQAYVEKFGWPT